MIGMIDFRDGLKALFEEKGALVRKPLCEFANRELLLDSRNFVAYTQACPQHLNYIENTKSLLKTFEKFQIRIIFVYSSLQLADYRDISKSFEQFFVSWESTYYSYLVYGLLSNFEEVCRVKYEELQREFKFQKLDAVSDQLLLLRYRDEILHAFRTLRIPVVLSPQMTESQLCRLLKANKARITMAYPSIFLFSDETLVLDQIDPNNEDALCFDLAKLAHYYETDIESLRKALFGCMLYHSAHARLRNKTKLYSALMKSGKSFADQYQHLCEKNVMRLDHLVKVLLNNMVDSEIKESFCKQIANFFYLYEEEVKELYQHFRSGLCANELHRPSYEPSDVYAATPNIFRLNFINSDFFVFYSQELLTLEMAMLLSRSCQHTLFLIFPNFKNVEVTFAYRAYMKEHIGNCLFRLLTSFGVKMNVSFKIHFSDQTEELLLYPSELVPLFLSDFSPNKDTSFNRLLKKLPTILSTKHPSLSQSKKLSFAAIRNFIKINLLSALKYIDLEEGVYYVPGKVLLDLGSSEFEEELIIIFELIRNNLFKPSTFRTKNLQLGQSIVTLNNFFVDQLSLRCSPVASKNKQWFSHEVESQIMLQSNFTKTLPDDEGHLLSTSWTFLLSIQKPIREFIAHFSAFATSSKDILELDQIATSALDNQLANAILLISRFLPFCITEFYLEQWYDQDSYLFREVSRVVMNVIKNINASNVISFLHGNGLAEDAKLIKQVVEEELFAKDYSFDASTFAKYLMVDFAIYKCIVRVGHGLEPLFAQYISKESIKKRFNVTERIFEALSKAGLLLKRVFALLVTLQKYCLTDFDEALLTEIGSAYTFFAEFCQFYHIPVQDLFP